MSELAIPRGLTKDKVDFVFFHPGRPIFHFRPKVLDLVTLVRRKPACPMRTLKFLDNLDQAAADFFFSGPILGLASLVGREPASPVSLL